MSAYFYGVGIVEVDDVFLYFSRSIIFVTEDDKWRMNYTFAKEDELFSFVHDCSIYLLFADFATQVVLEILEAIWKFSFGSRTDPIFHAKIVTVLDRAWTDA